MTKADLRKLYQRRLKLTRALVSVTALIQEHERSPVWIAYKRVHHEGRGCGRVYRNMKRSADWSMVDCIPCQKTRRTPPKPAMTMPVAGRDWAEVVP